MPVSATYKAFVVEQLSRVLPDIRARAMFGGVGVYSGALFFALIDDDVLYFKVDDITRPDFAARGMGPFRPFGEGGEVMQYYEVPSDVLEEPDALRTWSEKAVDVARRKSKARRSPKKSVRKPPRKS